MPGVCYKPKQESMSYGSWLCTKCKANFYGGGRPLHKETCPDRELNNLYSYANLVYVFGDKECWGIDESHKPPHAIIKQAKQNEGECIYF